MKVRKKIICILAIIVIIIIFTGCNNTKPTYIEENLVPVEVIEVIKRDIEKIETYSGKIKPQNEVNLIAKSIGKVEEIFFDVGDRVQNGNILFIIDKKHIENNIAQLLNQIESAEISINSASIALSMTEGSKKQQQINQSKDSVNLLKIAYDDTKQNYKNMQKLYDAGAISKQRYDQVKSAYDQTKINYESALKNHELLVGTILNQNIESAKNQLQQAITARDTLLIQLKNAKEALEDLNITSPIDGIVAIRNIEKGELTGNTQPSFVIVNTDTVTLDVNAPQNLINKISTDREVKVQVTAAGEESFEGRIINISPVADRGTLTYPITIKIENKDGKIKAGMFAEAFITVEKSENTVVVPRNHLKIDKGQYFAYTVEDDVVFIVPLTVGIDNGEYVEIKTGLEEGQLLISKGREYVSDGEKVKINE